MNIIYSNWGLANRIGENIFLNINLKKYPWLHHKLLIHEMEHSTGFKFNLKHDLKSLFVDGLEKWLVTFIFIIRYPKALAQLSPVWIYNKKPYFDISMIMLYIILFLMKILIFSIVFLPKK